MDDCFVKDNKCSDIFLPIIQSFNITNSRKHAHTHAHILHLILIFAPVSVLKRFPVIEKCTINKEKNKFLLMFCEK